MWSDDNPAVCQSCVGKVMIKNLDENIDHKSLYDTFLAFDNILSCEVINSS